MEIHGTATQIHRNQWQVVLALKKRPSRYRNEYLFLEMASSIGKRRSEEIKKKQEKNRKTRSRPQNASKRLWKRRTAKHFGGFYDVSGVLKVSPL